MILKHHTFSEISQDHAIRLYDALEKILASAAEAERIAAEPSPLWASIIGAESALAALRTNAKAARTLANTMRTKYDAIMSSGEVTEAQVADFESAVGAAGNIASAQAARQLSLAEAARQTAPSLPQLGLGLGIVAALGLGLLFFGRR